jgi:hypothetical protein
MTYQIILFAIVFVLTAIMHKPLNAHNTDKKWLKTAHYWGEIAVVIQGLIIVNELFKMVG